MPVNPNSHVPIYEQIVEHICGAVAAGVYRPGESLPSIRALALQLLVTPNTVQRAYQELERDGLAFTRKGLGVFVVEDGDATARVRSEAAVRRRFTEGIALGRAARIGAERMATLFHEAVEYADKEPRTAGDASPAETRAVPDAGGEDTPSDERDRS